MLNFTEVRWEHQSFFGSPFGLLLVFFDVFTLEAEFYSRKYAGLSVRKLWVHILALLFTIYRLLTTQALFFINLQMKTS